MGNELIKLLLDRTTMKVLQAAVFERLYPTQIANKLGKSKGYVTKKLNALEEQGVIKSRFLMNGGAIIKKFELVDEEILLKINLTRGSIDLKRKKVEGGVGSSDRIKKLFR